MVSSLWELLVSRVPIPMNAITYFFHKDVDFYSAIVLIGKFVTSTTTSARF
jgi:hypothetical protein